jgi:hypothetical protein
MSDKRIRTGGRAARLPRRGAATRRYRGDSNGRCDTAYSLSGAAGLITASVPPVASQLNRWLLMRRRAAVQRPAALAPRRRCKAPAAPVDAVNRIHWPHPGPGREERMHQSQEGGLRP